MSPAHPTTTAPAVVDLTSNRAVHRAIRQGTHRLAVATFARVSAEAVAS